MRISSSSRYSPRLHPEPSSKIILRAVWYRITDAPTKRRQLAVVMLSVLLNTAVRFSSLTVIFLDGSQPFWKSTMCILNFPTVNTKSYRSAVLYMVSLRPCVIKLPLRCNVVINVAARTHIFICIQWNIAKIMWSSKWLRLFC